LIISSAHGKCHQAKYVFYYPKKKPRHIT